MAFDVLIAYNGRPGLGAFEKEAIKYAIARQLEQTHAKQLKNKAEFKGADAVVRKFEYVVKSIEGQKVYASVTDIWPPIAAMR